MWSLLILTCESSAGDRKNCEKTSRNRRRVSQLAVHGEYPDKPMSIYNKTKTTARQLNWSKLLDDLTNKVSSWEALWVLGETERKYNRLCTIHSSSNGKQMRSWFPPRQLASTRWERLLRASHCDEANQNAFSYFGSINNAIWTDRELLRHLWHLL